MTGNITVLDSSLFSPIFSNDDMRKIMSDEAYRARLVEAEVALARVEGKLGVIPQEAANNIGRLATPDKIDIERLRRDNELVGLPIWGLSRQITEVCGASGHFVHWGANTHDIMDLAVVLQMKCGLELLENQIKDVRAALVKLTHDHRNTIMVARTHLQQALPTTFGYKTAVWLYSLDRHCERLEQLRPRLLMAQMFGASGSLASLAGGKVKKPEGLNVLKALAEDLHLVEPPISWHAVRDGIAEIIAVLAMIGGSLGKIAYDVCTIV
jgi:3-carboxy-cis,cis-muconate cycloisomerase